MSLKQHVPWTQSPLIINAPMGGHAGGDLAIAVTRAGGLGQIGAVYDMNELASHLAKVEQSLPRHDDLLPVGVGLLPFVLKLDEALPVLERYRPAVVWLFAAKELEDYAVCAERIRSVTPMSQIWIQVGSVAAAVSIAELCKPDVMCVQGIDAGGHGFEKGAGIISLLPEVADALTVAGHGGIPLVASGGITDGRGAAAAFALGAQGVVMGTRFLSAPETQLHPAYRKAILAARDGGQNTVRAKLFDELRGPNIWPLPYDGRSIVTESYTEHAGGAGIEEIRRLHAEGLKAEDGGYGLDGKGRTAMWAGTGVGLVKREQPAAEIVEEVRRQVVEMLDKARSRL
ncbi:hypothetical protein B0A55_06634 [Friedmanniomyces simplex]|uniref:Uncharacterized protein n=1 Tax=Friedmanniomyces simplex TaxID=329884 RepID=A0A4U0XMN3_9PEZI|nr:hypothetical protein B0A55_06634 [Friedmanniomyces simplex]